MEKRIARVMAMEEHMEKAEQMLRQLEEAWGNYEELQRELAQLSAYYESALWRQDYAADEAGQLPVDLYRGVLSEDGLYNLFMRQQELEEEMRDVLKIR